MILAIAVAITLFVLVWTFGIRGKDLPRTAPAAPWQHLEGRKAAIYENLRDLQFEYRVGKLSDSDYQRTKKELQAELAGVLAEIDSMKGAAPAPVVKSAPAPVIANKCPNCGAQFEKALKFCGECGKPMGASA
jgi:hypothetical protein